MSRLRIETAIHSLSCVGGQSVRPSTNSDMLTSNALRFSKVEWLTSIINGTRQLGIDPRLDDVHMKLCIHLNAHWVITNNEMHFVHQQQWSMNICIWLFNAWRRIMSLLCGQPTDQVSVVLQAMGGVTGWVSRMFTTVKPSLFRRDGATHCPFSSHRKVQLPDNSVWCWTDGALSVTVTQQVEQATFGRYRPPWQSRNGAELGAWLLHHWKAYMKTLRCSLWIWLLSGIFNKQFLSDSLFKK